MNKSGFIFSPEENSKGTTLIELAIVLAIIVIVGHCGNRLWISER